MNGKKKTVTGHTATVKTHYGGVKTTPVNPKPGGGRVANTSPEYPVRGENNYLRQASTAARTVFIGYNEIDIQFYQPLYANSVALLSSSKDGLAATAAFDFISLSGFTHTEFQTTFKTTVKTIQNYATQQLKLDSVLSEKLLKAFALFEKGIGVFGSPQAFHDWLNQPAYGLGDQLPYDLMDTITGIMLIEEELIRLEYGDLA